MYTTIDSLSRLGAFPTAVNDQITDSVTQGYCKSDMPSYYYTTYSSTFSVDPSITEFENEVENGYKIIANVAGASKENISVTYIGDDNIIRLKGEVSLDNYQRKFDVTYHIPHKFNVDELECSIKNGLLIIFVPYEKGAKPKEAKIS